MGLRDRIRTGLRQVWSPITVWMAGEGSDDLVTAGERAKAVVKVDGEDDGSVDRIELSLVMAAFGADQQSWPLGLVPTSIGTHEVEVRLPADLAPACARFAEYRFKAQLFRTKGTGSEAASVVDVIGRPERVYLPDGPHAGQDGVDLASIDLTLESGIAAVGGSVHGTVGVTAARDIKREDLTVALGVLAVAPSADGKFKPAATVVLAERASLVAGERIELEFELDVPAGVPPSLDGAGTSSISWQIRATIGDAAGWRWVGMLDPEATAGVRGQQSQSLSAFLVSLTDLSR